MIEREFVKQNKKEFQIQEYIADMLRNTGNSHIKMQRTPLGEKIIIFTSRPGLVVGREGATIKRITKDLKKKFRLENPQIEISEIESPALDANIVAESIAASLEKFGIKKFKGIGHKVMADAMSGGALGIEILMSGKIPGARAKSWRFYQGYLKKCGEVSVSGVNAAYATARLKTGVVGVQVRIMPSTTILPDKINIKSDETLASQQEEKTKSDAEKAAKAEEKAAAGEQSANAAKEEKPKRKRRAKKETKEAPKEQEKAEE